MGTEVTVQPTGTTPAEQERRMGCGCIEGTHGESLSEITPWHRRENPWRVRDLILLERKLRPKP